MRLRFALQVLVVLAVAHSVVEKADAQSYGVELHNSLMPASGGMAGTSIARPQDLQSAIFANPATLTQFDGTQFSFSGAWLEPTYNVSHASPPLPIPGVGTFSAKSNAQGVAAGNIGVIQDMRPMGLPVVAGVGLFAGGGAGLNFRHVPASNGTTALFQALEITSAVGVDITDRLSAGANLMLGSATLDGPFIGLTGAAYDYALRGAVGLGYEVTPCMSIGVYYQTRQSFTFEDAVQLQLTSAPISFDTVQDINLDLPNNIGLGIAHQGMMDGRLLLAADVVYKQWNNADFFSAIYDDQWIAKFGAQYQCSDRVALRLGYAFAENAMDSNPGSSAGGVSPIGGQPAIEYVQSLFAAINRHRLTVGVGVRDVMPGLDFDLLAGGMLPTSQRFGNFSSADVKSYWLGAGFTWRFGCCSSCE